MTMTITTATNDNAMIITTMIMTTMRMTMTPLLSLIGVVWKC